MKKRLLVVEDNAHLLAAISLCLSKSGFEVMTARDGDDALISIAETIPDLIVSDIMMPGTDGFAFARQIRSNPRTDLIPVVFLTAKDTKQDRISGFKVGVDAYLVKPFEPDELVAVIENILNRVSRTHKRVARASNANVQIAPFAQQPIVVSDLTEAEERVARFVAQSLSNKEIAAELQISVRTVEMHISNILAKKAWSNRVEIARFIIERESAR
ncbi:MAG: response regulator transcription factor [Pyrinomonadaceae bacterium]